MALDTRDKRASAVHVGLPWRGLFPVPDGTIDAYDRAQAAGLFRGTTAEAGAGDPLTAADVAVVVVNRWLEGSKTHVLGTLTLGDSVLTYPTGGVPLPSVTRFGFREALQMLHVHEINERPADYHVRYGPAGHTLLMYGEEATAAGGPLLELTTDEAPAARVYAFHAIGR